MNYALCFLLLFAQTQVAEVPTGKALEVWKVPIEMRVFAGSFSRALEQPEIRLAGCRNEALSAQLAARTDANANLTGTATGLKSARGTAIPADAIRIRYGAYLPVDETGQLTADPLLDGPSHPMQANVAVPVWLSIQVPKSVSKDIYRGSIELKANGQVRSVPIAVEVLDATLPDPPDYSFYMDIWQDPNGVALAHKVPLWSEPHWQLLAKYAKNLAQHGEKAIMASITYDAWNAQTGYEFPTMVEWRFPGEWTKGQAAKFQWDFTIFDRYVRTMIENGVRGKIDMYAMIKGPGPTSDSSIRYFDASARTYRTRKLMAGDEMWSEAWTAFLPVLKKHLQENGWWNIAYLGFDEKPAAIMDKLFQFIDSAGPDFKLVLSGGHAADRANSELVLYWDEINDAAKWDGQTRALVTALRAKGQLVSFYTACEPRFPNLFLCSTLREARMLAWVAAKYNLSGYTRWAVNAYPENVWQQPNFKWHSGDMYLTYPGKDGPLDGMRWELIRQGIQDFEALRIAREMSSFWGRDDLVQRLDGAVGTAMVLDSCRDIPLVEKARDIVNDVLREIGSPDEMGKKDR
jgi:hypothetical protein